MAVTVVTALCNSFKQESVQGAHCFNQTITPTGNTTTANATLASLSAVAGIAVGMGVSGTGVSANSFVISIDSASQVTMNQNGASIQTGTTLTFKGDIFKAALINPAGASGRQYDKTQTNAGTPGTGGGTATNLGTDEVSGDGYSSGGIQLVNVTPAVDAGNNGAFWGFSANPAWTSASFSSNGMLIYNAGTDIGTARVRLSHANGIAASASGSAINRAVSTHSFSGTQTVASGTFTVTIPTTAWGQALYQLA